MLSLFSIFNQTWNNFLRNPVEITDGLDYSHFSDYG